MLNYMWIQQYSQELYEEKEQELWVELQKNNIVKMLYELFFTKGNAFRVYLQLLSEQ